jgi:hypothetical protein
MIPGVCPPNILGEYSPIAVIHNVNNAINNSHFYIYIRAMQNGCQSVRDEDYWLLYNDSTVTKLFDNLNDTNSAVNHKNVYMVMYELN